MAYMFCSGIEKTGFPGTAKRSGWQYAVTRWFHCIVILTLLLYRIEAIERLRPSIAAFGHRDMFPKILEG